MPQGFKAAGDVYTRRYDDIIKSVPNKVKIVDDALLHNVDIEESFFSTWDFLTLLANNGIVASAPKFQFCQKTVDFGGLTLTPDGITPSKSILSAIENFPTPPDITGARSWFGLVNQVAWAYAISPIMTPFRDLIKPKNRFYWDDTLERLFQESKQKIIDVVQEGVKSFDPNLNTCVQTDWCKEDLGYLLLQQHCKCPSDKLPTCCPEGWRLIFAGSKFTKPSEFNYSPTEGEALAVSWSLGHSKMFTLGCPKLFVSTDHKPLLGILNDKDLASISNSRLLDLKETTFPWDFKIQYNPGKWHRGPDAVSRNPSSVFAIITTDTSENQEYSNDDSLEVAKICHLHYITKGAITPNDLQVASQKDAKYAKLLETISNGFPNNRQQTDPLVREYWEVRDRLTQHKGIAYMDYRIVVPQQLRKEILSNLHAAHQGATGMRARANNSIYWPGMSSDITNTRLNCKPCTEHAPSQPAEPLIPTPFPDWPFQKICADYFFIDLHSYLIVADRYSGWISVYYFPPGEVTSATLVSIFREIFSSFGVPEELSSDGGPQFIANEFEAFLKRWGVSHRQSSAEYAQSNGRAELGVKAGKRIVRGNTNPRGGLNNDDAVKAILQYRNTPLQDCGLSPAQILFHRHLRDSIPCHTSQYKLHSEWVDAAEDRELKYHQRNHILAEEYNRHTRSLKPLSEGTHVLIQGKDKHWNR